MSISVNITPGRPQPRVTADNVGCIIGKLSGWTGEGIYESVMSASELTDEGITVALAPDLHRAVNSFFDGVAQRGASNIGLTVAIAEGNAYPSASIQYQPSSTTWAWDTMTYEIPELPIDSLSAVYLKIGSGYVSQSYSATTDDNGQYTGDVVITSWEAWNGTAIEEDDIDSSGNYVPTSEKVWGVYMSYALSPIDNLLSDLLDKDINFVTLAFDATESAMTSSDTYTSSNLIYDYLKLKSHCSAAFNIGKSRMFFGALPAGVQPTGTDTGFGLATPVQWNEWPQVIGARDAIIVQHDVTVDAAGASITDPAAYYMGTVCGTSQLRDGFLLASWESFPQTAFPTNGQVEAWKRVAIGCVHRKPHVFNEKMLTAGYTLGSDPYDRIETVRCTYWMKKNLEAAGWKALAKNLRTDYAGCKELKALIEAVGILGQQIGACDGIIGIDFPLLDAHRNPSTTTNAATIATAKSTKSFGTITVTWELYPIAESITMSVSINR